MRPKVRPMTHGDKSAITQILVNTPEFKPAEVLVAEELIDSYLENQTESGYYLLVAEVGSSVVGYICYGPTPLTEGTWDIYWIAVSHQEQGQGIGSTLLACAEDKIKKAQGRLSLIETSSKPNYEKTRRFHQSQGYQLVSQIPDFYEPGDDKLTYQKRLR